MFPGSGLLMLLIDLCTFIIIIILYLYIYLLLFSITSNMWYFALLLATEMLLS